jgi:type 2 lantibiotic biosynthesis protein LanM
MHYENVIACGDQPVLVDVETLFHSGLPLAGTAGPDPAADALADSVHSTGLLPQLLIGQNGALDISALGRFEDGTAPSDGVRWEGSGTDGMRVVRVPVASPAGQNQPLPGGRGAGRADHRAALLEGFRVGYDAIVGHRGELLAEDGILARLAHAPARLIVRPTRLYAALLEESLHPDLLSDALARDAVFALLWAESAGDPARQRLIEEEIAELWRGDVPLFLHRPTGTAVWTGRGARLDEVLPVAGLAAVRTKIAAMSEVDRYDQEWIIAASLAVGGAADRPRSRLALAPASAAVPSPSRLLAAAGGIADEIAVRAVRGGGRANWLGLERVAGEHWALMPMGGGLGEGYCGVALFLAEIGALTGARQYTALAAQAVRPLAPLLSALAGDAELSASAGPGALSGLGGIVYALVRLSALLGEDAKACIPDALVALTHAAQPPAGAQCAPLDLADGLAGALTAAVLARRAAGASAAPGLARRLADRLLAHAGTREAAAAPGFARGEAGIGWALLRYARAAGGGTDTEPYAAAGTVLLRSALDTALGAPGDLSWHSGLAGAALAAGAALDPAPGEELDRCVRLLAAGVPAGDLSLYQGSLGLLEPLLLLAGRGHAAAGRALTRCTGEVLGLIEQQGPCCGTPDQVPSPGLLTGLSGIGYTLLRLGFPDSVPSVLLFDDAAR